MAALPQTRTISLHNIHTRETLTVEYKKNGRYVPDAMDQIDWILRDWRKNEKTRMDPELIDLLWEVHAELGSREPIHVISAYRSQATNNMLRASVGGQASQSRHILGKAADVHFPDIPVRRIRYSALIREKGGVGYYPTSAIPFVHLDTDRVRAWPRLPRHELALLFPNGRTQHVPADGQPLTPADVHVARSQHRDLAMQVAEVHQLHRIASAPAPMVVAGAGRPRMAPQPEQRTAHSSASALVARAPQPNPAPLPQLVAAPRLVDRPSRLIASQPSDDDRRALAQLAALASFSQPAQPSLQATTGAMESTGRTGTATVAQRAESSAQSARPRLAAFDARDTPAEGRFAWGAGRPASPQVATDLSWVTAPAYDDEHPEELFYRPFPLAPYLTQTDSPDDPALARMEHPDALKTLELLDHAGEMPAMRLRPGQQVARLLWAQRFQGEAVALASAFGDKPQSAGLTTRPVRLSAR